MRMIIFLITLVVLAGGGYYLWETNPQIQSLVEDKIQTHAPQMRTLEIRHSAEALMAAHKTDLLKNAGYTYLEPQLTFHPYLLMEVKYAKGKNQTEEGMLFFGLVDGEMVIDGNLWEKTHGFEDCLLAHATKEDFKILRLLSENGGTIDKDTLYQKSKVDVEVVDSWLEECRAKKLIVISGNTVRLHLEKPKLSFSPITKLQDPLVTSPIKESIKIKRKYSPSQVEKMSEAAFGSDFAIRRMEEVYLPVYYIRVQNPDGSILTTQWNGLTGSRQS